MGNVPASPADTPYFLRGRWVWVRSCGPGTSQGGQGAPAICKICFWAVGGGAVTALIFLFALPVYFLGMVAVFSFYSAFAAYRVLYLKDMYKGARPKAVDWAAAVVTLLSSLLLFLMGFLRPELMRVGVGRIAGYTVSIVSIVFGLI